MTENRHHFQLLFFARLLFLRAVIIAFPAAACSIFRASRINVAKITAAIWIHPNISSIWRAFYRRNPEFFCGLQAYLQNTARCNSEKKIYIEYR